MKPKMNYLLQGIHIR